MASDPADLIKQTSAATFKQDVIEESKRQPVIVELWSGRSGPTVLGLLLEKAVHAAHGRVKVARVDVDKEPTLVGSLAPRLVPALSAYVDGQQTGGILTGLVSRQEGVVTAFVERLIKARLGDSTQQDAPAPRGPTADAGPAEIVRTPIKPPLGGLTGHIFVSHVAEDREPAFEVVGEPERRGFACWIAPRNVPAGKPYDDEIVAALESCGAVVLIFSSRCNTSDYIRREVTVAGELGKLIIPYRIENAEPQKGLRIRLLDLHRIDAFAGRDQAMAELLGAIGTPELRQ